VNDLILKLGDKFIGLWRYNVYWWDKPGFNVTVMVNGKHFDTDPPQPTPELALQEAIKIVEDAEVKKVRTHGEKKRRKLYLRWVQQKTLCCWCEKPTVLIFRPLGVGMGTCPPLPNEATIEHLRSKNHPDRLAPHDGKKVLRRMACWKCNNERNTKEQLEIPLEELHRRSGEVSLPPVFKDD